MIQKFLLMDFSTTIPYVAPLTHSYAAREGAPDITTSWKAAIAVASAAVNAGLCSKAVVQLPSGLFNAVGPIIHPNGVYSEGAGDFESNTATWLRNNGPGTGENFVEIGASGSSESVINAGIRNVLIFRDHGINTNIGTENPAGALANVMTGGAQIAVTGGFNCEVDVAICGGYIGLALYGPYRGKYRVSIDGIWDTTNTARQEGVDAIYIGSTPTGAIPTYCEVEYTITGDLLPRQTVSYPAGSGTHTQTTNLNIGFQNGVHLTCFEKIKLDGWVQACSFNDILFETNSLEIMQGCYITGDLDPCGTLINNSHIFFKNTGDGGQIRGVSFRGHMFGEGTGYRGVSDFGWTGAYPSCNGLIIDMIADDFVGAPVYLSHAKAIDIRGSFQNYNFLNFYSADETYLGDCAAVWLDRSVVAARVDGVFGGFVDGASTGHSCIYGVYCHDAVASKIEVTGVDNGLIGGLWYSNGQVLPYPVNLGVTAIGDADHIATWGGDAPVIIADVASNTAVRYLTLSHTDLTGRSVPQGSIWSFSNIGGGAYGWQVNDAAGVELTTLSTINSGASFVFFAGAWRFRT